LQCRQTNGTVIFNPSFYQRLLISKNSESIAS